MVMIELKVLNLHWLEGSEAERDLCAHGSVYLKIGNIIFSEEKPEDWTVSTTAYYFLKTLKGNHDTEGKSNLIPHCGHTMWEIGEEKELYIGGCDIGIDWNITHSQGKVIHKISKDKFIETDFEEWRNAVCNFSDEVMKFYEVSSPKIVDDEEDKKGFELFMKEWKRLRAEAFD
jgi:hypothetical protein